MAAPGAKAGVLVHRSVGKRPDEIFSRDGPLSARADVRLRTSDGKELFLHRIVLEMWSSLFADLIAASEEGPFDDPESDMVSITLLDTAADLYPLLACLYPTKSSTLDAPSALPLLLLADKYHCPHVIHRCAEFTADHVLPRLSAAANAADAACYLQLAPLDSGGRGGSGAVGKATEAAGMEAAVVEWVVTCVELATRLELGELAERAAELLGRRFFEWGLQANRGMLTRLACVLPPDQLVGCMMASIPAPQHAQHVPQQYTHHTQQQHAPAARVGAGGGGGGGGGGPRIVPVMVAAAGPAAAVAAAQENAAAPPQEVAVAVAPPLLAPPQQPQVHPHQAAPVPQPFQAQHQQQQPQHQPFLQQHAAPAFWQQQQQQQQQQAHHHHPHYHQQVMPFGGGGGGGGAPAPEPLLGPGPAAGW